MDEKIVFVRTGSGEDEARSRTALLSKDIKRALLMVDGTSTVAEIKKRSSPSLRAALDDMFAELARDGFIQDKARAAVSTKIVKPAPLKKPVAEAQELDFTAAFRVPTQAVLAEEAAKLKAAEVARSHDEERRKAAIAEERARLEAAEARGRELAKAEKAAAESARLEAEQKANAAVEAARLAEQQAEKIKAEAQDRARAVAEEKAQLEAEVAKLKAIAEAEAHARAEEHARLEAEKQEHIKAATRTKAEKVAAEEAMRRKAERQAKAALEAARLAEQHAEKVKNEAQDRARAVAEEKARLEAEVAKLKAVAEAEAQARAEENARLEAERIERQEALRRAKAEKAAAEEAARREAERKTREALDAARLEAELQAEKVRIEAERIKSEAQAKAQAILEEKVRLEAEVAKLKAIAEAEAQAKREAEVLRIKAEQEAERIKAEQEAERIKAEQEAERIKAEQEAEAAIRAEQEAQDVLSSVVRLNAEHETVEESVFLALNESVLKMAAESDGVSAFDPESSADRRVVPAVLSGCDSRGGNNGVPVVERRTTTAAVLFLDIASYTKQPDSKQLELKAQFSQLLTDSLASLDSGERIALDTGDGAAIGFLQHPADALESAVRFRTKLIANKHFDYPELRIRVGIHLGPVSLVKDVNGQINMLGDGINSAQRVMSFAGLDQILVSRAYFDFVSSMSDEYDKLFRYRGSQKDKHGREYRVYELVDGEETSDQMLPALETGDASGEFNFEAFDVPDASGDEEVQQQETMPSNVAEQLLIDTIAIGKREESEPVETAAIDEKVNLALEEEANTYAGAEAVQLADAQEKKWQEAEQRAKKLAKERAESVPQQRTSQPSVKAKITKPGRAPWGKIFAGLLLLIVAALFVVPPLLPMQDDVPKLEKLVGSMLNQPVHIERLSGRLLPSPRLEMEGISIGDAKQIHVARAQANFSLLDLFGAVKPVTSLDLQGLEVQGDALQQASSWVEQIAANREYPIMSIKLAQGKLDAEGMPLSDVDGELNFSASGKFAKAHLNAMGHKLVLDLSAGASQKLALSVALHDSALPFLPNWTFDDMKATGELGRDEMRINDLDSRIRGGMMTGNLRINWRSGWRVQGELVVKVLPLENINKLLNGDMDGTARFQAQAESLKALPDAAFFNGVFEVKKGMISGVDIVETTRLQSRESLPGGRTHFDEMNGEFVYSKDAYRFAKINIRDSVFQVNGAITVTGQTLSGRVSSNLTMRGGMTPVMLQVSGTTDSPALRMAN